MKKITLLLMFLFASVANAGIITVDYEVTNGNAFWGNGNFSGMDNNNNGFIEFSELVSFDGSNNIENETVDLTTLFDIGDFDIANNMWLSNGIGWNNTPDNAWFTWNNRNNSVNSTWAAVTTRVQGVPVPEPTSYLMIALGLAGLAASRRNKVK